MPKFTSVEPSLYGFWLYLQQDPIGLVGIVIVAAVGAWQIAEIATKSRRS